MTHAPTAEPTTPAYQPGRPGIRTCIMLSAPGRHEEDAGLPAAGATGTNLNTLLEQLHTHRPDLFPTTNKSDYAIINAHPEIEYPGKTGRSEAALNELRSPKNLERLERLLEPHDLVLALGAKARAACEASRVDAVVLRGIHPGNQAINLTYKSSASTGPARRCDRIHQFALDLLQQL